MPLFDCVCVQCGQVREVLVRGKDIPPCGCGGKLNKLPSYPAMVKVKGEGGYPSRRKFVKGTAPYCGSAREWDSGVPFNKKRE